MAHVGLVCPPMHGHMHPMFSLGRELVRSGHRVTVISLADARAKAAAAGLEFHPIGLAEFPEGSIPSRVEELGRLTGGRAVLFTMRMIQRENRMQLAEMPAAIETLGLDVIATDQTAPAAGSVADAAGLPWVTVCNALMIDQEPAVPPVITNWSYSQSWWARLRNHFGFWMLCLVTRPVLADVNHFRRAHNLAPLRDPHEFSSPLAILSQTPAEFDFPRERIKPWFHYVGPFQDTAAREPVAFPFERLDGRPLVYASLGTLQNRVDWFFRCIAEACATLPVQLVMALGGANPDTLRGLPGDPVVVRYAPQLQLLQKASLAITHAGLNTTLESLANGVPLVAIPITNDQPGVAMRVAWTGVGERILPGQLNPARLRAAIERVMSEGRYRERAVQMQRAIASTSGAVDAVRVIEAVLATRAPVVRPR